MKKTKIVIAGMGGQGVQTIAKILALAIVEKGWEVSSIPQFGVEQRGTPSMAFIILDEQPIGYPLFQTADWLLILFPRAVLAAERYIGEKTKVIFDSSLMAAEEIGKKTKTDSFFGLPAVKLASEKFSLRSANLIILGKISQLIGLPAESVWQATEKILEKKLKEESVKKESQEAFLTGYQSVLEEGNFSQPNFRPQSGLIELKGAGKRGFLAPERCKGCGICLVKCPVGAIKFGWKHGVFASPLPEIDLEKCNSCGNCFLYCPEGAIGVEKDL